MAVHNFGKKAMEAQRTALVNSIKATGRCAFNDEYLNAQTPEVLEALAKLAGAGSIQNGAGGSPFVPGYVPGVGGDYTLNAGGFPNLHQNDSPLEKDEDGLDEPVLNFGKAS
jgi:hypothetical protein